ncbi:hypothetical protein [Spirulina sp. CCNP1310]|nr:hypothetical protein [Spirulina sp. CCNP1310]
MSASPMTLNWEGAITSRGGSAIALHMNSKREGAIASQHFLNAF